MDLIKSGVIKSSKGSGWGNCVIGERITNINQVKPGDILAIEASIGDTKNILKIIPVPLDFNGSPSLGHLVYCIFVDPNDFSQKRLASDRYFVIWDFEFSSSKSNNIYYRVKGVRDQEDPEVPEGGFPDGSKEGQLPLDLKNSSINFYAGSIEGQWVDKKLNPIRVGDTVSLVDWDTEEEIAQGKISGISGASADFCPEVIFSVVNDEMSYGGSLPIGSPISVAEDELLKVGSKQGSKLSALEANFVGETVLLEDGTCGKVKSGVPQIGEEVTLELHDENGMTIEKSGIVSEILEESINYFNEDANQDKGMQLGAMGSSRDEGLTGYVEMIPHNGLFIGKIRTSQGEFVDQLTADTLKALYSWFAKNGVKDIIIDPVSMKHTKFPKYPPEGYKIEAAESPTEEKKKEAPAKKELEKKVNQPKFQELKTRPKPREEYQTKESQPVPNVPVENIESASGAIKALIEKQEYTLKAIKQVEDSVLESKKAIEQAAGYADKRVELVANTKALMEALKSAKDQQIRWGEKIYAAELIIEKVPKEYAVAEKLAKLLEKYGSEAEKFLEKSQQQLGSILEETNRVVTFPATPKKSSSMRKHAGLFSTIKNLYMAVTSFFGQLLDIENDFDNLMLEAKKI